MLALARRALLAAASTTSPLTAPVCGVVVLAGETFSTTARVINRIASDANPAVKPSATEAAFDSGLIRKYATSASSGAETN